MAEKCQLIFYAVVYSFANAVAPALLTVPIHLSIIQVLELWFLHHKLEIHTLIYTSLFPPLNSLVNTRKQKSGEDMMNGLWLSLLCHLHVLLSMYEKEKMG